MELLEKIEAYWTERAEGYSAVNQGELETEQKSKWRENLQKHLKGRKPEDTKVLDIGTGPGFFAILLAEAGYQVTAVDYTEEMLKEARKNAGKLAEKICWRQMDAQKLEFEEETFDVVVSRNLTWNLEKPEKAYEEWLRVLRKGGKLLNYDANWYHHLFDKEKRKAYEEDRKRVEAMALEDHYTCTDIDAMEEIARKVPLSRIARPRWDREVLKRLSCGQIQIEEQVWQEVWSREEKANYQSTPMFLVEAVKGADSDGISDLQGC